MSEFPCYDTIGHGKLSIHFAADYLTIETIFRIIVIANQLSLYGAVAEMCEEYESLHDRSGRSDKVMGQSIVLSEIKTEVPLENDDPAYQNFLLQQYEERIERLGIGQWSFIGPGSEKKWYPSENSHKVLGTMLRKRCCYYSQKVDILSFAQRLHCPGVS